MMPANLRRLLRLERITFGLTGVAFGFLLSMVANLLSGEPYRFIPIVGGATVILALISGLLVVRNRPGSAMLIRSPRTIRTAGDAERYARRGYVGFVPLYKPLRHSAANQLSVEQRLEAAKNLDFDALDIANSNLQPTVQAISTHAARLGHCWLLSTACADPSAPGSQPYVRLLAEYLRQVKNLRCHFHYGEPRYCVPLDDDSLVLSKTYDHVRDIFIEAEKLGIGPQEIIGDVTTGTRSMMLGIALACLDQDHDFEFVGTRYNEEGQPTGALLPVIYSVEAQPKS